MTHLVKKLSAMLFLFLENEPSPMRFFFILFFYSQGSMFMYFVIFKNRKEKSNQKNQIKKKLRPTRVHIAMRAGVRDIPSSFLLPNTFQFPLYFIINQ